MFLKRHFKHISILSYRVIFGTLYLYFISCFFIEHLKTKCSLIKSFYNIGSVLRQKFIYIKKNIDLHNLIRLNKGNNSLNYLNKSNNNKKIRIISVK